MVRRGLVGVEGSAPWRGRSGALLGDEMTGGSSSRLDQVLVFGRTPSPAFGNVPIPGGATSARACTIVRHRFAATWRSAAVRLSPDGAAREGDRRSAPEGASSGGRRAASGLILDTTGGRCSTGARTLDAWRPRRADRFESAWRLGRPRWVRLGRLARAVTSSRVTVRGDGPAGLMEAGLGELFRGKRVLITGGLGFLGSNLARELVEAEAEVVLVDSLVPEYGGNRANIAGIEDRVTVNISDVRDSHSLAPLLRGQDVLFNLAGQTSHLDSMTDPFTDLEINCRAQLSILETCRAHNPDVKVVFASTRQIYGRPRYLPVDEAHPGRPGGRQRDRQGGGRGVSPRSTGRSTACARARCA